MGTNGFEKKAGNEKGSPSQNLKFQDVVKQTKNAECT